MRDIRIVHDRIGSYADWLADDNSDPTIQEQWLTFYWDKYLTGKLPPNYQVPATRDLSFTATCWVNPDVFLCEMELTKALTD